MGSQIADGCPNMIHPSPRRQKDPEVPEIGVGGYLAMISWNQRKYKHGGTVFGHAPGSRAEYELKIIDWSTGLASFALEAYLRPPAATQVPCRKL